MFSIGTFGSPCNRLQDRSVAPVGSMAAQERRKDNSGSVLHHRARCVTPWRCQDRPARRPGPKGSPLELTLPSARVGKGAPGANCLTNPKFLNFVQKASV